MKTAIVFADSHNNREGINKLIPIMNEADYIICLGDAERDNDGLSALYSYKYITVRGNCDFDRTLPEERTVTIEGAKLLITHGHNYRVKSGKEDIILKGRELDVAAVLYGHTHLADISEKDGIKLINPGNMSGRGRMSYCYMVINNGRILARIVYLS